VQPDGAAHGRTANVSNAWTRLVIANSTFEKHRLSTIVPSRINVRSIQISGQIGAPVNSIARTVPP
jgi:hypothetical protein